MDICVSGYLHLHRIVNAKFELEQKTSTSEGLIFALPALLLFFEKGFVKARGEFHRVNSGYASERSVQSLPLCIYTHDSS